MKLEFMKCMTVLLAVVMDRNVKIVDSGVKSKKFYNPALLDILEISNYLSLFFQFELLPGMKLANLIR